MAVTVTISIFLDRLMQPRCSGIDAMLAREMRGVIAVLTGDDARADGLKAIPHLAAGYRPS
jgi:hypothetical protein